MILTRRVIVAAAVAVAFTAAAVPSYAEAGRQARGASARARVHPAVPRVTGARPIRPTIKSPLHLYSARRFGFDLHGGWARGGSRFGTYGYDPFAYGSWYGAPLYGAAAATFGGVRITNAPRNAEVYVDGYYAGLVDDFDGRFQRLQLEPGGHRIEIRTASVDTWTVDVNVQPGRTTTLRADIARSRGSNRPQG